MAKSPHILLVNPWITDFAAYDLWSKPVGLLLLAALLRQSGCDVSLVDCLDRHDSETLNHPEILSGRDGHYGTGKYPRMRLPKPGVYQEIPRFYYRYGIHPHSLRRQLEALPQPDLVWVTSMMTYWYPGVQQSIAAIHEAFPRAPVWLGGIYARLCTQHAIDNSGAHRVVTDPTENLPELLENHLGRKLRNHSAWRFFPSYPPPALDLITQPNYAPLLTSRGCPFACPYCASKTLFPGWERRSSAAIFGEIVQAHHQYGIIDFAFYDDALLLDAETTLKPALQRLCREGFHLRLHTPNALHIRALTREWCKLLHASGFTTIRLGLETTQAKKQREWGAKVETAMFLKALDNLQRAGFDRRQIGVYLLCGLPGQSPDEVVESIRVVQKAGAQPYLAEYSPLPATPMWSEALKTCSFDISREPLYHNNSFFACRRRDFSYQDLLDLKASAQQARNFAL
jgi:radical SAM superfamily enzyme YgiQ (UPF0313 family)